MGCRISPSSSPALGGLRAFPRVRHRGPADDAHPPGAKRTAGPGSAPGPAAVDQLTEDSIEVGSFAVVISILRGFAFSLIGMVTLSTPLS